MPSQRGPWPARKGSHPRSTDCLDMKPLEFPDPSWYPRPGQPWGLEDDNPSSATFELRPLGRITSLLGLCFSFVKQHLGAPHSWVCCGMGKQPANTRGGGGLLQGVGVPDLTPVLRGMALAHWSLCMDLGHLLPLVGSLWVAQGGWTMGLQGGFQLWEAPFPGKGSLLPRDRGLGGSARRGLCFVCPPVPIQALRQRWK